MDLKECQSQSLPSTSNCSTEQLPSEEQLKMSTSTSLQELNKNNSAVTIDLEKDISAFEIDPNDIPNMRDLDVDYNSKLLFLQKFQDVVENIFTKHWGRVSIVAMISFFILFTCYFFFAVVYSVKGALALIVITPLVLLMLLYGKIRDRYGSNIYKTYMKPVLDFLSMHRTPIRWLLYPALAIFILLYLVLDVYKSRQQLIPLCGLIFFMTVPLVTSKHVTRIRFQPVIWGMGLQFLLGVLVLRWVPGYQAVKFLSDQFTQFLTYSLAGASIAFGNPWFFLHPFVFMVSAIVIFMAGVTSWMFYMGITQAVVSKMAWLMRHSLGTTGIESVSIAANIFFHTLDLMQMFRSYIPKLTKSEFHTFTVGCHASIAGFAYGLFVIFGANPQHLLTAAVMSAPAAVAVSKLNYPETENSNFESEDDCKMEEAEESSAIEAISNGAWQAGKSIATLIIQVLVFMSGFEWLDATVRWFGSRVGFEISLRIIFSYLFLPFAYVIGIEPEDAKKVSSIVGLKLVTSEMLAFIELGQLRQAKEISERSAALTTYAICGFSSIGTLSMMANVWGTVSKTTARDALKQLPRVFINCNIACFITACVAGILYDNDLMKAVAPPSATAGAFVEISKMIPDYRDIIKSLGQS